MARDFAIDDDVQITVRTKRSVKADIEAGDTTAAAFWNSHAAYWRERGNEEKARECEANAYRYRGQ